MTSVQSTWLTAANFEEALNVWERTILPPAVGEQQRFDMRTAFVCGAWTLSKLLERHYSRADLATEEKDSGKLFQLFDELERLALQFQHGGTA